MAEKTKKTDIEAILKANPQINKNSFELIRRQLQQRKAISSKRAKYNLLSPFARHNRTQE